MLLSFVLLFLSIPGGPLPFLTWIVFVPVGLALLNTSAGQAARLFYFYSIGVWLCCIWWMMPAVINFTQLNAVLAFLVLFIFCLILAIPHGIIGYLIHYRNWLAKPYGIAVIAMMFVVIECWYPNVLPGNQAHSLYIYPSAIQIVDLGGVPLLLFVTIFVNWQIVKAIHFYRQNTREAKLSVIRVLIVFALVFAYGEYRLFTYHQEANQPGMQNKLKVGFIQPNLMREDNLDRLYTMSEELVRLNSDLDLLIWPEFPTAFSYIENTFDRINVDNLIHKIHKPMMIVSGYIYESPPSMENPQPHYYNTAHLINENAVLLESYNKQLLAPFFEYLPWENSLPMMRTIFPESLIYAPGNQSTLFKLNNDVNIIPLICYEIIFPELTQNFIAQGGNMIVNMTNDFWFGASRGSSYHLALGLFRSVEHKVPWIRATNSGISVFVTAAGEIIKGSATPLLQTASRTAEVFIPRERTLYSKIGDLFLYLITFGVFLIMLKESSLPERLSSVIKSKKSNFND